MNSHELQKRIQAGDREAFRELYALCGRGVFLRAQEAFPDADTTRNIVKQVFLNLHNEIFSSDAPLDIDMRLEALTDTEIRTQRILAGDFAAAEAAKAAAAGDAPATEAFRARPAAVVVDIPPQSSAADMPPHSPVIPDMPAQNPIPDIPPQRPAADIPPQVKEPLPEVFEQAEPYRTPLERTQSHMEAEPQQPRRKKRGTQPDGQRRGRGGVATTILIVLFLLLFLWLLIGILMDFSVLPRFDLGFRWFNEHIFPLFSLTP